MERKKRKNLSWSKPNRSNSINHNEIYRRGNISHSEGREKRIKLDYSEVEFEESGANSEDCMEVNQVFDLRQKLIRDNTDIKLEESYKNRVELFDLRQILYRTDLRHRLSRQQNNSSKSDEQNQHDSTKRECPDSKQKRNNETQFDERYKHCNQINNSQDVNASGRRNQEQNLEGSSGNNIKGRVVSAQMSTNRIASTVEIKSRSLHRNSDRRFIKTSKKESEIAYSYDDESRSRKQIKRSHSRKRECDSSRDRNRHCEQINNSHDRNIGGRSIKKQNSEGSYYNNIKGRISSAQMSIKSTDSTDARKSRSCHRISDIRLIQCSKKECERANSYDDGYISRKQRMRSYSRERRWDSSSERNKHCNQINSSHDANVGGRRNKEQNLEGCSSNNIKGKIVSAQMSTKTIDSTIERIFQISRNECEIANSYDDGSISRRQRKRSNIRERRHNSSRDRSRHCEQMNNSHNVNVGGTRNDDQNLNSCYYNNINGKVVSAQRSTNATDLTAARKSRRSPINRFIHIHSDKFRSRKQGKRSNRKERRHNSSRYRKKNYSNKRRCNIDSLTCTSADRRKGRNNENSSNSKRETKYDFNSYPQLNHEKKMQDRGRQLDYSQTVEREIQDHYKTISIIPKHCDIYPQYVHLQPILERGKYNDTDHLFDVNFRLMREDFIRPLRNGIVDFRRIDISRSLKNINNVRIYEKVLIGGPRCTFQGIGHTIKYDTSRIKTMRRQLSKRLMNGSLLCLSCDNFMSLYFAIVDSRIPDQPKGSVDVTFVCDISELKNNNFQGNFTMVESETHFETYNHVLKALQNLEDMPFESYIASADINVKAPQYIYDTCQSPYKVTLKAKSERNDNTHIKLQDEINIFTHDEGDFENIDKDNARDFYPLKDDTWPLKSDLGLDDYQYEAMKSAITKEFSLIQGPPGTGKTFIGLKIIQCLLSNKQIIDNDCGNISERPILVVCYTNHALDQFLEGIENLNVRDKEIVRVGGGCKSSKIAPYSIQNKRKQYRSYPGPLIKSAKLESNEKRRIKHDLTLAYSNVEFLTKGIVHEEVLKDVMGNHYLDMLVSCNKLAFVSSKQYKFISPFCNTHLENFMLLEWLFKDDHTLWQKSIISSQRKKNKTRQNFTGSDDKYYMENENRQFHLYEAEQDIKDRINNHSVALLYPEEESSIIPDWLKVYRDMVINSESMTEGEAMEVTNVWTLSSEQRWKLYNYWVKLYKQSQNAAISDKEQEYMNVCSRNLKILDKKDTIIMKKASVLGMTTTGAAKYQRILQKIQPKIIVEEAAEVFEAHVLTTLTKGCEHLILIGDHKQLRPKPACYEIAEKFNLKISLFERMINNDMPHVTLQQQHRMRPEISSYMRHIYDNIYDHSSVLDYENIRGIKGNVCFIRHSEPEDHKIDLMAQSNDHEARFIVAMFTYLLNQGYDESRITILSPYSGQVEKLEKYLPKKKYPSLTITTIDNFQGEENDIILMSLVRSNKGGKIGFIKEENRICVSLSRAKIGLYVIGNFKMLTDKSRLWGRMIESADHKGEYKEGLEVLCQNHPEESKVLKTHLDFARYVPKGGCTKQCTFRLPCGHNCKMKCHPFDRQHINYRCQEKCGKQKCKSDHKCKLQCHFEAPCGDCKEYVDKEMPSCKHTQKVECCFNPIDVICKEPCSKVLTCGHACNNKCGDNHTHDCEVPVDKDMLCGHTQTGLCSQRPSDLVCTKMCEEILKCGHRCSGTCGDCLQGRVHMPCRFPCKRIQVCGHICQSVCSVSCPPCEELCENVCFPSKSQSPCGFPCYLCREPCNWSCKHMKCKMECSDVSMRVRCDEPCYIKLRCGHRCIWICGEVCPRLCRICMGEEVEEIVVGTEDEADAKFIELGECGHKFEVNGMDHYINVGTNQQEADISVKPNTCPKCKTPIRVSKRYHCVITKIMADVKRVKHNIWGDERERKRIEEKMNAELCKLSDVGFKVENRISNNIHRMKATYSWLSKSMVICITNVVQVLHWLIKMKLSLSEHFTGESEKHVNYRFLIFQMKSLRWWSIKYRENINDQENDELQKELLRIDLFVKCCIVYKKKEICSTNLEEDAGKKLDKLVWTLRRGFPFDGKDLLEGKTLLKEVSEKLTGLGVTEEERVNIGLKPGAWHKCPNGHIYCIGECGGAMEKSTCPECKVAIGGTQYTLAEGNQHAVEMDLS